MKTTYLYFLNSPKRNGLLSEIVSKSIAEASRRKPLIDVCKTRRAERHWAHQHFYQCFILIIKPLEVISMGLHTNELTGNFATASWDHDWKSTAASLLHGLTDFSCILNSLFLPSHLSGITIKLHSSIMDIIDAYQHIDEIKYFTVRWGKVLMNTFTRYNYKQSERMATAVDVQPLSLRAVLDKDTAPMQRLRLLQLKTEHCYIYLFWITFK